MSLVLTLIIDQVLLDFMQVLKAKSGIKYEYKSNKEEQVEIVGDGLFADLAKTLAESVNKNEVDDFEADSSHCLPKIGQVNEAQLLVIFQQFVLLVFLSLFEVGVKRFNRNVCAFFYRKWEKKRIIWLYNDTLKKRIGFIKNAKKKITFKKQNGLIENEGALSRFLTSKLQNYKYLIRGLTLIGLVSKRYCVLCNHSERRTSLQCKNCLTVYCFECWYDLVEKCVSCSLDFQEEYSWEYNFEL